MAVHSGTAPASGWYGRTIANFRTADLAADPFADPAADGAGVDVDALASKRELESIRVELSKLRRQGSQDHEALRLEVQQIKRALAVQKAMAAAE